MFYTPAPIAGNGRIIHLFPSPDRAAAHAREGQTVIPVSVQFEDRTRRIRPLPVCLREVDRTWETPGQLEPDGSVIARGPIPAVLFDSPN